VHASQRDHGDLFPGTASAFLSGPSKIISRMLCFE
jgi:hypothetical protein